jgi:hypothetical protein
VLRASRPEFDPRNPSSASYLSTFDPGRRMGSRPPSPRGERGNGEVRRLVQFAFLRDTSIPNLSLFISGQRESTVEEFVSEANTCALALHSG